MAVELDDLTRAYVQRAREQYEALADLPDDLLAEKLLVFMGAGPTASERAIEAMTMLYRAQLATALSHPSRSLTALAQQKGAIEGLASAARILCEEANIPEPTWIALEMK